MRPPVTPPSSTPRSAAAKPLRLLAAGSVIPIVTPEEMAAIDAAAPEPVEVLIERAGAAVARAARADARRDLRAAS